MQVFSSRVKEAHLPPSQPSRPPAAQLSLPVGEPQPEHVVDEQPQGLHRPQQQDVTDVELDPPHVFPKEQDGTLDVLGHNLRTQEQACVCSPRPGQDRATWPPWPWLMPGGPLSTIMPGGADSLSSLPPPQPQARGGPRLGYCPLHSASSCLCIPVSKTATSSF